MPLSSVYRIASSRALADWILHDLKEQRFPLDSVGLLFRESPSIAAAVEPIGKRAASFSEEIRGVMQAMDGIGRLQIPGEGAYIAGGSLRQSLKENLRSQEPGPLLAALRVLGVPTSDAILYEQRLKAAGTFLISVQSEDIGRVEKAKEIFKESNGLLITSQLRPVFDAGVAYRDQPVASAVAVSSD